MLDCSVFSDCVANGGDAISRLADQPYAMIVLDVGLPHAGAAAVLEWIRALPAEKRPMIIAMAAATRALETDGNGELVQMVLRKPLRVSEVASLVGSCLSQVRTV